jgi:hypothetical protein
VTPKTKTTEKTKELGNHEKEKSAFLPYKNTDFSLGG